MMYMDDAVRATIEIMEADPENIGLRYGYNLTGMSFTPAEIAEAIRVHLPDFTITYKPDFRQAIAASWTENIDDSRARSDWGWQHQYDLQKMTQDMIKNIKTKY